MDGRLPVVAIVGLGYVGLPLAVEFGLDKSCSLLPFQGPDRRVVDGTRRYTNASGDTFAVHHRRSGTGGRRFHHRRCADTGRCGASTGLPAAHQQFVGRHLKRGAVILFKSTVYPGATEEICVPVREKHSGLKWKKDFNVGYSPE
jgi:UDP-N-acetyl-D-galactosamine dehydrogenase